VTWFDASMIVYCYHAMSVYVWCVMCQVWENSLIVWMAAVVYYTWTAVCQCWVLTWLKAYDVCSDAQRSNSQSLAAVPCQ